MVRPPPPVLALGAAVAQRAVAGEAPRPGPVRAAAAMTVAVAAVSMAGSAAGLFRRSGTTIRPEHPEEASALVTEGAFAMTRNPMYVGLTGLLVAHAAWRGSWAALLPAAGFVAVLDRTQIRAEEEALREKFGPEYEAYSAGTPRWIDRRSFAVS